MKALGGLIGAAVGIICVVAIVFGLNHLSQIETQLQDVTEYCYAYTGAVSARALAGEEFEHPFCLPRHESDVCSFSYHQEVKVWECMDGSRRIVLSE